MQDQHIIHAYTDRSFDGTPKTVAARIEALQERTGTDAVMLVVGGHSTSLDQEGISLIADHYAMPRLVTSLAVAAE